jgi:hypothetical protein
MRIPDRAAQIWAVLALAARNRQVLTYAVVSRAIGVPAAGLGQLLEPIQSYCLLHKLPPLTILVVNSETGMPGSGFVAAKDIPKEQQRVFALDWLEHAAPSSESLAEAAREASWAVSGHGTGIVAGRSTRSLDGNDKQRD